MKLNYIKSKWNNLFVEEYSALEWKCMKIYFAWIFLLPSIFTLYRYHSLPYPVGVFQLLPHAFFLSPIVKTCEVVLAVFFCALYIADIRMVASTLFLFAFSVSTYSIAESNGVWGRNGLLSLVFFAQFIAYSFHHLGISKKLDKNKVQFSLQAIAAVYVLAAISKINASGLNWITDAPNLSLQIVKQFSYEYVNNGDINYQISGMARAHWVMHHPLLIRLLLAGSLFLEAFSFVILIDRKWAFIYGLLLLSMHIGIKIFMNILFESISLPMVAFCINPLYIAYLLFISVKTKFSKNLHPAN